LFSLSILADISGILLLQAFLHKHIFGYFSTHLHLQSGLAVQIGYWSAKELKDISISMAIILDITLYYIFYYLSKEKYGFCDTKKRSRDIWSRLIPQSPQHPILDFRAEISVEGTEKIYGASLFSFAPFRNRECAFYCCYINLFLFLCQFLFRYLPPKC